MADDLKLSHAREFTDIEDTTLDAWLQAENANLDDNARRVLDAGLMYEHYTSLLDNDPDKRQLHELTQQQILAQKLQDEIRQLHDALAAKVSQTSKLDKLSATIGGIQDALDNRLQR